MKVRLRIPSDSHRPFEYLGRRFERSRVYEAEWTDVDAMGNKLPHPAIWVGGVLWEHGYDEVKEQPAADVQQPKKGQK